MVILYVGIDLAKSVFAMHGVNEAGKPMLVRPSVARAKLHELIASLPPCVIGMEACSGAHHWARLFMRYGHTVRLLAPKFVVPYRLSGKRGKNDAADAAAICEALQRPNMRSVPVKTEAQQAQLSVHRAPQGAPRGRVCNAALSRAPRQHPACFTGAQRFDFYRRVTASVDESRLDLRGECLIISGRRHTPSSTN